MAWGALWNDLAPRWLPRIKKASTARVKRIRAALHQLPDQDDWRTIYTNYGAHEWLRGEADIQAKPSADWLLARHKTRAIENYIAVLEGTYTDQEDHYER